MIFFSLETRYPLDPYASHTTNTLKNVRATSGHLPSPTSLHTLCSLFLPLSPSLSIFN